MLTCLFNKIAGLRPAALLKRDSIKEVFPLGLRDFFRTPILYVIIYVMQYRRNQPPRGVPWERFSENTQQIYRRTPVPKCDFNKVALQFY